MTSDTEVKDVKDQEASAEPELLAPLPVGAHPASIRSLSHALQELQAAAKRAQYVSIVEDRPAELQASMAVDDSMTSKPVASLTEYALSQQAPGVRATSGREASRLYAGAKLII